ncbi:uncharacterized protein LOC126352032 [Schistocerca gregaria]|uniref:uncharacterized protein LOC126352032 n=1 Tax=Schistocerca gregaria TaxID=7010 RepID=UPI00211F2A16|nr:uncharacterized protein LOC126352032 [Schistocerca gregaria]
MPRRRNGGRGKIAAVVVVELLLNAVGSNGCGNTKKRKPVAQLQCYKCQKLGHITRECDGVVAGDKCGKPHDTQYRTKPRGTAAECVNCGDSHAANACSCSYLKTWEQRKFATTHEEVAQQEENVDTPLSYPSRGSGLRHKNDVDASRQALREANEEAITALKSAIAEESAALRAELEETRREVTQLRAALYLASRATPDVAPTRTSTGVDVATQTTASLADAAMQVAREVVMQSGETADNKETAPRKQSSLLSLWKQRRYRKCGWRPRGEGEEEEEEEEDEEVEKEEVEKKKNKTTTSRSITSVVKSSKPTVPDKRQPHTPPMLPSQLTEVTQMSQQPTPTPSHLLRPTPTTKGVLRSFPIVQLHPLRPLLRLSSTQSVPERQPLWLGNPRCSNNFCSAAAEPDTLPEDG